MKQQVDYKGITYNPSDDICQDGQLAAALGVIPEDESLRPIFHGTKIIQMRGEYDDHLPPSERAPREQVLYIHRTSTNLDIYITLYTGSVWYWQKVDGVYQHSSSPLYTPTGKVDIASIGNVLIINDETGTNYVIWRNDTDNYGYTFLGNKPPVTDITFGLESEFMVYPGKKDAVRYNAPYLFEGTNYTDRLPLPFYGTQLSDSYVPPLELVSNKTYAGGLWASRPFTIQDAEEFSLEFKDAQDTEKDETNSFVNRLTSRVMSRLQKFVGKEGTQNNKFVMPFFVTYAYEMFDGSLMQHSSPVLMIPNSKGPIFALDGVKGLKLDLDDNGESYEKISHEFRGRIYGFISSLEYKISSISSDLEKWKDVIKGIKIYVSAPMYTYKQSERVWGWQGKKQYEYGDYYSVGHLPSSNTYSFLSFINSFEQLSYATCTHDDEVAFCRYNSDHKLPSYIMSIPQVDFEEQHKQLSENAQYYEIAEFEFDDLVSGKYTNADFEKVEMAENTLTSLTARTPMTLDYYSSNIFSAKSFFNYNNRINQANVERKFLMPHNYMTALPFVNDEGEAYQLYAVVNVDGKKTVVKTMGTPIGGHHHPMWIFVPEPNATHAIYKNKDRYYQIKLTRHKFLNGAYWLGSYETYNLQNLPEGFVDITDSFDPSTAVESATFSEPRNIYTSNVNNPFVFVAKNTNELAGDIITLASATEPMSQGQFGQYPLYAFTTEGVYAMSVDVQTGAFSSINIVSRDVCTSKWGVQPLDKTVVFATVRGLMMLSGNQSECITTTFDGEMPRWPNDALLLTNNSGYTDAITTHNRINSFAEFITNCRMSYDYINQRLLVYNREAGTNFAYVFSLKSKQWGMMYCGYDTSLNAYPECIAASQFDVFDVSKPNMIAQDFMFLTRPFKFGASGVLKSISELVQRGFIPSEGTSYHTNYPEHMEQVLYGTRDFKHWLPVTSSNSAFIRRLGGTPFKAYRLLVSGYIGKDKSLDGFECEINPKFTNKLR